MSATTRMISPDPLPIDRLLPDVTAKLRERPNLVIEAAAGSGKTTRVPAALLALGGEVLVLEPRRIAARMAARRVAWEMGQKPGETVGFQVRFEDVSSARTRLRFLTEGVLTRRLLTDELLSGVETVVLDEFHERHLDTDLALALLRRMQKTGRPDLRIVIMSATIDPEPVSRFLGGCPVIRSEGRLFPIEITHLAYSASALEDQVAGAVERVVTEQASGDVLVFLPGAAEIRRAQRACRGLARRHGLVLAPLYGDLSPEEQDLAVTPGGGRKVILSTNIAESSITIEGVTAVIDSGLAKFARDSPWTGLPSLELGRISKASANQRAARAGRTAPGRVLRLYTAEDFHRRPAFDEPEMMRRELSQMCLQLESMEISNPFDVEWLDDPPAASVAAAERLLDRLHARGERGENAAELARLPVHPRLARLIREGSKLGVGEDACAAAAILSSGERVRSPDFLRALEEPMSGRTRQVYDQIRRMARPERQRGHNDEAIARAVLAGFPDRVMREGDGFVVSVDVRLTCPVSADWLLDEVTERTRVEWNRAAERVDVVQALVYDDLVIDETRAPATDSVEGQRLLAHKVFEAGIGRFVDQVALDELLARIEFASRHSSIPALDEAQVREAFAGLLAGLCSFVHVRQAAPGLLAGLEQRVDKRLLEEIAPAKLRLPSGRQARIHYERGKTPWVASRLQDFFGMSESPRIARGKAPLVLHLLAPNQRPVQMTTDLAGFWQRLYPQLRKELGRRYPKHAWPENPV